MIDRALEVDDVIFSVSKFSGQKTRFRVGRFSQHNNAVHVYVHQLYNDEVDPYEKYFGELTAEHLPAKGTTGWDVWSLEPRQESVRVDKRTTDISDWRAWAHNEPGDCPCGIARSRCEFHR